MSSDINRNTMKNDNENVKNDFSRQILLRELHSCESSWSRKQNLD